MGNIIRFVHYLLMVFILVGHSLLPIEYIKYYLILVVLIFIDWNDLDGQCILTRLEHYFNSGEWNQKTPVEGGPEFFRPIVNNLFNLKLDRLQADRLNNIVFLICWLIALLRVYHKL